MENPEILGRIQMEQFIPVEIFRKKVISFELLPFSRLSEMTEIVCTTCLDYQCQASGREKAKNLPVFCKWYNSIPFLFSLTKTKYQQHLKEIFHRNSRTNGKRSKFGENRKRKRKTDKVVKFFLVNEKHLLIWFLFFRIMPFLLKKCSSTVKLYPVNIYYQYEKSQKWRHWFNRHNC